MTGSRQSSPSPLSGEERAARGRKKLVFYSSFGALVGILGGLPPALFFWYSSKSLTLSLAFPVVFALSGVLVALYITWFKLLGKSHPSQEGPTRSTEPE